MLPSNPWLRMSLAAALRWYEQPAEKAQATRKDREKVRAEVREEIEASQPTGAAVPPSPVTPAPTPPPVAAPVPTPPARRQARRRRSGR